jgi:hypothetical protein
MNNRKLYKGLKLLISMDKQPKEKICNLKVYKSTWKALTQKKLDMGFKSIDELLNVYYGVKEESAPIIHSKGISKHPSKEIQNV